MSYWKTKSAAAGEQVKRLVAPFFAVIRHDESAARAAARLQDR